MRFIPADPDIATIYNRIQEGEIDLQPDFQRGEVWTAQKQQRLIDSILRGWIVPPVVVIGDLAGGQLQVLDGQQRLAAIRDFKKNMLPVDGNIAPPNDDIKLLHGKRYLDLPTETRRVFDRTTIRIFHVTDYSPEEPAEIFFRLNQPTALTSAEKRNAFFGPVRSQIRNLVSFLIEIPEVSDVLGFSNSRMAYDDFLARFACVLENGNLNKKITAGSVDLMYRRKEPINHRIEQRLRASIQLTRDVIGCALLDISPVTISRNIPRLNKATALSWLIFFSRIVGIEDINELARFFLSFELTRQGIIEAEHNENDLRRRENPLASLVLIYNDRATARVADVSSVLLRDLILWYSWFHFSKGKFAGSLEKNYYKLDDLTALLEYAPLSQFEDLAAEFIELSRWGSEL